MSVSPTTADAAPTLGVEEQGAPRLAEPTVPASRRSRREWAVWIAAGWLLVVVLGALLAPVLPLADPGEPVGPGRMTMDLRWPEPLGTDALGRSMLSRLVYGGRQSLVIATAAVVAAFVIGGIVGAVAGYFRGSFDRVVAVVVDAVLSVPALVFLLAITAALRPSVGTLVVGLGVVATPGIVRVARAQTIAIAQREFILAATVMGASNARILRRFIAPSLIMPLSTFAVILLSVLMIAEGSLSFLGVGVPPPAPSWGGMIAAGQSDLERSPSLVFLPACVLLFTVISLNVIGEWARRRTARPSRAL